MWPTLRWDFCTAHFRLVADLDAHLQQIHVARARPEPIPGKRRKVARGVYVVVSEPKLAGEALRGGPHTAQELTADQLPLRYSQTTGDVTTTTDANTTLSHPYPPSFPSQPTDIPPDLLGTVAEGDTRHVDAAVNIEAFLQFPSPAPSPRPEGESESTQEYGETQSIPPSCGQQPIFFDSAQAGPPTTGRYPETQLSQVGPSDSPFVPPTQPFSQTQPTQGSHDSSMFPPNDEHLESLPLSSPSQPSRHSGPSPRLDPGEKGPASQGARGPRTSGSSDVTSTRSRGASLSMGTTLQFGAAAQISGIRGLSPEKSGGPRLSADGVGFGWGAGV